MFVCHFCKKVTKPRVKVSRIATKTEMYNHPHRFKAQPRWGFDKQGKKKLEWIDDKGGFGVQICKEVNSCPDCAVAYEREKKKVTLTVHDLVV